MTAEFRIPVVELYGTLLVPIQVALSDQLILNLKDDVSRAIQRTNACGLVIDLSGVDILDSYLSCAIHHICSIAKLMGLRSVLTGMNAAMAMTLVEMGLAFKEIDTARCIEDALDSLRSIDQHETDGGSAQNDEPGMVAW